MTAEQKAAFAKTRLGTDVEALTLKERALLKAHRAMLYTARGEAVALVVRFDCKWVRID